jgi:hypothetical protein
MPLTPEEILAYQRLYPGLPLEVPGTLTEPNAPVLGGLAGSLPSVPTVSTGQAPTLAAPPSSVTAQLEQLAADNQARLKALEAGGQPSTGQRVAHGAALGLAAVGDVARGLYAVKRRLVPPAESTVGQMLALQQKAGEQRQAQILAERQHLAATLNHIGTSQQRDAELHEKAWKVAARPIEMMRGGQTPTKADVEAAMNEATGLLAQAGIAPTTAHAWLAGAQRSPDVTLLMSKYAPFFDKSDPKELNDFKLLESNVAVALIAGGAQGQEHGQDLVRSIVEQRVSAAAMPRALAFASDPAIKAQFPNGIPMQVLLAHIRTSTGPKAPLIEEYLTGRLGAKPDSVETYLTDLGYKGLGVAKKAQEAGATKEAEAVAAGPALSQDVKDVLLGAGLDPRKIDIKNPVHAAAVEKARQQVGEEASTRAVKTATATGAEAARIQAGAKLAEIVSPEDRAKHVDLDALRRGELVQPPAGIREGQLRTGNYRAITPDQKTAITNAGKLQGTMDRIFAMADRVITAQTPSEGAAQAARLEWNKVLKSNPAAAGLFGTQQGFSSVFGREMGGQKGNLSDRDLERIDAQWFSFNDTVGVRELKKAVISEILDLNRASMIAEVAGEPIAPMKSRITALLDDLEQKVPSTLTPAERARLKELRGRAGRQP